MTLDNSDTINFILVICVAVGYMCLFYKCRTSRVKYIENTHFKRIGKIDYICHRDLLITWDEIEENNHLPRFLDPLFVSFNIQLVDAMKEINKRFKDISVAEMSYGGKLLLCVPARFTTVCSVNLKWLI